MSDQSVTGFTDRSQRPAMFGTLAAADAGSRSSYQLPGRSPAAGIINFSSNGIFNLPRYYPTYLEFDNELTEDDKDGSSTWRSGEHQRTIPFYQDQLADDDRSEPIYSRPNKAGRYSGSNGVVPLPREQFTVALGSDLDSSSSRDRRCCRCCVMSCFRRRNNCCGDRRFRRSWTCCCDDGRHKRSCKDRPICLRTSIALIALLVIAVAVAIFLAIFLLVTNTGLTSSSLPIQNSQRTTAFVSRRVISQKSHVRFRSVIEQEGLLPQSDRASAFVVDRVKICLAASLITEQNLAVVCHIVCAHVGGPKNFEDAGPLGMRAWLTPGNALLKSYKISSFWV